MKLVCGLGNPGSAYDATRHNVGWWLADRLCVAWGLGPFIRTGASLAASGRVDSEAVTLLKPQTYMNRSGAALAPFRDTAGFDPSRDLLVVVDDAALDVARVRFRSGGSSGGHNGLKSVEAALATQSYARLRIGVGAPPPGTGLSDWVLSPLAPDDEDRILALLPELVEGVRSWVLDGIEVVMTRFNR